MIFFKVFRYNPERNNKPYYDEFKVETDKNTTVLESLYYILENLDSSLAWRSSCRAAVCGSCGMRINGRYRLACRTLVKDLKKKVIVIQPLGQLKVIKDLVVDMTDFYKKYEVVEPYLIPKEIPKEHKEFYQLKKDRKKLDGLVECILCGSCYAACTMCYWDNEFPGPFAFLSAHTRIMDNRDSIGKERLLQFLSESGIWRCHTELGCTDACPKGLKPTESINYFKREAVKYRFSSPKRSELKVKAGRYDIIPTGEPVSERKNFLKTVFFGGAGLIIASLLGIFVLPLVRKQVRGLANEWIKIGPMPDISTGKPVEVIYKRQKLEKGILGSYPRRAYLVKNRTGEISAIDPTCTHLGCVCYWDEAIKMFMCPCHGGAFDFKGNVKLGPPPRPLKRLDVKIENRTIYVRKKEKA